jgi:hypothetical protein
MIDAEGTFRIDLHCSNRATEGGVAELDAPLIVINSYPVTVLDDDAPIPTSATKSDREVELGRVIGQCKSAISKPVVNLSHHRRVLHGSNGWSSDQNDR